VRRRIWCTAILGWACATPTHPGESGFGIGLALAHDSNIFRVETNPQGEWTQSLLAGLFFRENTIDVTARVHAQVERRHFYHHTFSDDTGGFLDGATVWTILPRQFNWTVEDTFREVQIDVTAPNTPSNLTKSNTLSTGPDFTFPLSSTNSAVLGGRYGRFDIKNSINDNQRYTGYVRGVHALTPQSKISLNYEAARVYFEPGAQLYSKALRKDWFGRFENRSAMNTTTIDIGTSRATTYGAGPDVGGRLARATFSETLSSQSTVRIALSDQVSDTYTDLLGGVTISTAPRDPAVVVLNPSAFASGDLYHSKRGDLGYANNDGRFGYTLQGFWRRVDFVTQDDNDYLEKGGAFLWSWVLSGSMRFGASGAYSMRAFANIDRQDTDRTYGVTATYRLNSNVTVATDIGRIKRQSTVPLQGFVDNRVVLVLGYSSGSFPDVRSRR